MTRILPALLLVLCASLLMVRAAHADGSETRYTREDVEAWADGYAWWYARPGYPHDTLLSDVLHVMGCETGQWDPAVINNVRRGRLGEVGSGQFLPRGGIWQSTPQAHAGYSMFDVEANVAALVWGVSRGHGPQAWRSCW